MRNETRAERYKKKALIARELPFSFCATNFSCDGNIAYLARALACFGGRDMHIIGKEIAANELSRLSGGHSKLVNFIYHKNPIDFLNWSRVNNCKLVVAELADGATDINDYNFDYGIHNIIVVGNEMDGVPVELSMNGDLVYIPMVGRGFCLNTSQTANIMGFQFSSKFKG